MKIEIVLYEGFEELDALGPFEVLAAAGLAPTLVTLERNAGRSVHRNDADRGG